jgi:hypothetical protein
VRCWSWGLKTPLLELNTVPPLENPRIISAGDESICAIDDNGLRCWDAFKIGLKSIPLIANPKSVAVGTDGACAIGDEGATCWNWDLSWRKVISPLEKHPRMVTRGSDHFGFVLDDDGVRNGNGGGPIVDHQELKNPFFFSQGYNSGTNDRVSICAIDTYGLKCRSDWSGFYTRIPASRHPSWVSTGKAGRACALSDLGIECNQGNNSDFERVVFVPRPSTQNPSFRLIHLQDFFEATQKGSVGARALLLQAGAEVAKADLAAQERSLPVSQARYLLISLLRSTIEAADSAYFLQTVIPAFSTSMASIEKELGFSGAENISRDSELNRMVALKVLRSALSATENFLPISARAEVQTSLRAVGIALADPMRAENIHGVESAIDSLQPVLKIVTASSKSAFLVTTILNATAWLKGAQ